MRPSVVGASTATVALPVFALFEQGDPLGNGTGGESIWGGEFEDEFHRNLRHDRPFTLSMANAGERVCPRWRLWPCVVPELVLRPFALRAGLLDCCELEVLRGEPLALPATLRGKCSRLIAWDLQGMLRDLTMGTWDVGVAPWLTVS